MNYKAYLEYYLERQKKVPLRSPEVQRLEKLQQIITIQKFRK